MELMRKLGLLLSLTIFNSTFASGIIINVHDIVEADEGSNRHLILAQSGSVFQLDIENNYLLDILKEAKSSNRAVVVEELDLSNQKSIDNDEAPFINDAYLSELVYRPTENTDYSSREIADNDPLDGYHLTEIENMDRADEIFKSMRRGDREDSQCYNRAHVWSYELNKNFGINSGKIFIFFTPQFIRRFNFKWWFHVSPYVKVRGENDIVMDRKYFKKTPEDVTYWKNFFLKNDAHCPIVTKYTSYEYKKELHDCYLMKVPMYYSQPWHVEHFEKEDRVMNEFSRHDVELGYKQGFGVRGISDNDRPRRRRFLGIF